MVARALGAVIVSAGVIALGTEIAAGALLVLSGALMLRMSGF